MTARPATGAPADHERGYPFGGLGLEHLGLAPGDRMAAAHVLAGGSSHPIPNTVGQATPEAAGPPTAMPVAT